jgi:hypothetical protein
MGNANRQALRDARSMASQPPQDAEPWVVETLAAEVRDVVLRAGRIQSPEQRAQLAGA